MMHKKADEPFSVERRGDVKLSRGMPIQSHSLQLSGIADVVEFRRSPDGVHLKDCKGLWDVVPVEYKSGKKKHDDCNEVQLCAQAMCLEEMFATSIPKGYLFYAKTRRTTEVNFEERLRERVRSLVAEMYTLYDNRITPAAVCGEFCQSCSLVHICVPKLSEMKKAVEKYVDSMLRDGS